MYPRIERESRSKTDFKPFGIVFFMINGVDLMTADCRNCVDKSLAINKQKM